MAKSFNPNHLQRIKLVEAFVKNPDWGKELRFAKKLLATYSLDFLLSLDKKGVNSLIYFLTEKGKERIMLSEKISKMDI